MRRGKTGIGSTIFCQEPNMNRHKRISAWPQSIKGVFDNLATKQIGKSDERKCTKQPPKGFFTENLVGDKKQKNI